jgi:hypothetical protein
MNCEKCKSPIDAGEERELHGQILCEDCYMDLLSPAKACDPWAVHSAKTLAKEQGGHLPLTEVQERILAILDETGGVERGALADRLQMTSAQLEREIAALRHMEKVQGEKREGNRVFLVLWKG